MSDDSKDTTNLRKHVDQLWRRMENEGMYPEFATLRAALMIGQATLVMRENMAASEQHTQALVAWTRVLAFATVALVIATAVLAVPEIAKLFGSGG